MKFLTEPEPVRGVATEMVNGILRLVAPNAGSMTYHGTNSYLVPHEGGWIVIDPGPDDAAHVDALLRATGGNISHILLTHGHADHVGAVPRLRRHTTSPVCGFSPSIEPELHLDVSLDTGDNIANIGVIHIPGHAKDHLAFTYANGVVFCGDHVMGWRTTSVRQAGGGMRAYMSSLRTLAARADEIYLPGHGPMMAQNPTKYAANILARRQEREGEILSHLSDQPLQIKQLVTQMYNLADEKRLAAAAATVEAHMIKLEQDGLVVSDKGSWSMQIK